MESAITRGLTFRMTQTPVQHYLPILIDRIQKGGIEPPFVITHRASLQDGPALYKTFRDKQHGCIKILLKRTVDLLHRVGRDMRARNSGRILITGSIAGFMPGTYQAVYNARKAFLDSFSFALRHELKDTNVTVTCQMPGATETDFFERADMMDTKVGTQKDDAADFAKTGFDAMMRGDGDVVAGWHNKLQAAIAHVAPAGLLAEAHRKMGAPGTAQ